MILNLDRQSHVPLYVQIAGEVRQLIRCGTLKIGDRLPPNRTLAESLGVNRSTVETAYDELLADGLIASRVGSGTYVVAVPDAPFIEAGIMANPSAALSPLHWGSCLSKKQRRNEMHSIFAALMIGLSLFLSAAGTARAQSDADREAIKQTALDYIEGYYNGDAARMERSLHPDLAKRIVRMDPSTGKNVLNHMTAAQLIQATRMMQNRPTPKDKQQRDVTILDVFENAASVKIVANDWIDYLHVAKFDGRWVIANVLWEMKPRRK